MDSCQHTILKQILADESYTIEVQRISQLMQAERWNPTEQAAGRYVHDVIVAACSLLVKQSMQPQIYAKWLMSARVLYVEHNHPQLAMSCPAHAEKHVYLERQLHFCACRCTLKDSCMSELADDVEHAGRTNDSIHNNIC